MFLTCPLCQNSTDELIPIVNPGKQYKQCCRRCVEVAYLITNNYPYSREWYDAQVPIFKLLFPSEQFPFDIENGVAWGEEARQILKTIRGQLMMSIVASLTEVSALDVVTCLARLFSDVSLAIKQPTSLEQILVNANKMDIKNSQEISVGYLASRLDGMRITILFLQKLAVRFGSNDTDCRDLPMELLLHLITLAHQIDLLAHYEDGLYYLPEWAGIAIFQQRAIPVSSDSEPVQLSSEDKFRISFAYGTLEADIAEQSPDSTKRIIEEFYSFVFRLDEQLTEVAGFSVSELFHCYMGLASFAEKYGKGTFVMTPHEFRILLTWILASSDTERIDAIAAYLQYTQNQGLPAPYEMAHFYSPIFLIPVGDYGLIVINDSIVDHARSDCFHDLTYGVHPLISDNKEMQKAYNKIKQKYATAPFETQVANIFISRGWIVRANVTGGILVGNKTITVVPDEIGEIDILASSSSGNTIIVVECKYLFDYGAIAKEIKSLRSKFMNGKKPYFSQVNKKNEWVSTHDKAILEVFGHTKDTLTTVKSMIVTRNIVPYDMNNDVLILSINELDNWLDRQQNVNVV